MVVREGRDNGTRAHGKALVESVLVVLLSIVYSLKVLEISDESVASVQIITDQHEEIGDLLHRTGNAVRGGRGERRN